MNTAWRRALAWGIAVAVAGTAVVLACGPFFTDLRTVREGAPADRTRYARGELGVVKPTFARRYLVQAYRTLGGVAPLSPDDRRAGTEPAGTVPSQRWRDLQARELPAAAAKALKPISTDRIGADYSSFTNCLEAAFARALDTYAERTARYGARSRQAADWLAAQAAVFQNCAACHGPDGRGNPGPAYPALAGQHAGYTAQQLTAFRAGTSYGRDENANLVMVGVSKYLTDEEIQSLASYVQGLHTAAGEVAATR